MQYLIIFGLNCEHTNMNITEIRSVLDKKEFRRFGEYIKSPYFNSEPRFIRLFEILDAGKEEMTREQIAESFFGNSSAVKELRFRKLISEFMKLFKAFLSQSEYDLSELTKRKMELQWLRKKKDIDGFFKLGIDTNNYIKDTFEKDEEYYLELIQIFSKIYEFRDSNLDEPENDFCFVINDYLDMYFLSMKLFLFQRIESLEYSVEFDITELKTFEKCIYEYISNHKEELKSRHPEIYLRYISILLNKSGFENALYEEYIAVLSKTEVSMNINDYGLLLTLLNTISKFMNSGRRDLEDKVIEVAELLYNMNLIVRKGIGYVDLKIIIEAAIRIKKFDWALEYMSKVKDHIKYENPRNAYDMLSAKILFFKSDFKTARLLLSSITIDDYIFYCEAKLIECRMAFMESDHESVLQISETVKKYLKSHKEIGAHFIRAYNIFADIIKRLSEMILKHHKKSDYEFMLLSLKKEVNSLDKPCYAHRWIIGQIEKMKAGN